MILSATLVLANFGGQQANAEIGKITGALERSVLLTNRPRPRTRPRPRLLLVRLERHQPVGSIGYGFFDPATARTCNQKSRTRTSSRTIILPALCADRARLEVTPVNRFVDLFVV